MSEINIERLKAKVDVFRRACEDLLDERDLQKEFIVLKQSEAAESAIKTALRNLGNADLTEEDIERFATQYIKKAYRGDSNE